MTRRPPAILALEDGRVFRGESFGAATEATGEVVFNTAMTGYQEVLSDPSYCGQIVTFTYPLMGNYGVNDADWESGQIRAQAMVCREVSEIASNWRSTGRLQDLLDARGVPGICGIDTRALTRHLRDKGVMRGCVSATDLDADALVEKARKSPSSWWPRQMPNVGTACASSRDVSIAKSSGSGSPGPLESTTPAGSSASTSRAGVRAGTTRTRNPSARSRRRMLYLTPKSITAASGRSASPSAGASAGPAGVHQ